uniref:hypothetical protein n=1 Tax=Tabrizicola sp. TaxID=2005166 RepID=UPI002FDCDC28
GPHGFAVAECLHLPPMEINENQQVFFGFAGRCRSGVGYKYTDLADKSPNLTHICEYAWTLSKNSILLLDASSRPYAPHQPPHPYP